VTRITSVQFDQGVVAIGTERGGERALDSRLVQVKTSDLTPEQLHLLNEVYAAAERALEMMFEQLAEGELESSPHGPYDAPQDVRRRGRWDHMYGDDR
jgi:hypothetical protein